MRPVLSDPGVGVWTSNGLSALLHGGILILVLGGFFASPPTEPTVTVVELVLPTAPPPEPDPPVLPPPQPPPAPEPPPLPAPVPPPAPLPPTSRSHPVPSRSAAQGKPSLSAPPLSVAASPSPPEVSSLAAESLPAPPVMVTPPLAAPAPDRAALARAYGQELWQQILHHRPRRSYVPGTAYVRFRLDRNGQLLEVSLDRSSGSPRLDEAAETAVRRASPFTPPPASLSDEHLIFVIPFSTDTKSI